ncbi:glycosyltransferase family 4 protein [Chamaesiphon polymorphus]|uniref:Uncharacterized protein n=1 Tax=Chamaesiphon polymorphus CCALA 037 TaxID=2107692 RepID=A0A2T1GCM3_9CYAN|nr:glycosyltransferase family 4 protein [Chamaesiphon polymorphus]PSB55164.1 hypothetical protein C7B77_15865 [Chamaesiphon polymorphus CCALA 037]
MQKEIVFISHEASRSGAPILLLQFLRWFKEKTNIPFRIILVKGGELESDFIQLAPTLIFDEKPSNGLNQRIKRRFFPDDSNLRLKKWLVDANIQLIYSNTLVNGNILELLEFINCPVISHAHELEYIIQAYGIANFEKVKKYTTHFIACANAVKTNLIEKHNIACQNISVIHGFIPITFVQSNTLNLKLLINELNIPDRTFIVGGSGSALDWRKGADLFIQLAYIVKSKARDSAIRFVWVGSYPEEITRFTLTQDIMKAELENYIYFIGVKANPLNYFAGFDVFTLTSREDPYPLVCLEAASLAKPIICFDKSGGEPEFVENDCGFVIPYLDLNLMADCVIKLYESPCLLQSLGVNAKHKVMERHSIEIAAPKILEIIKNQIE